MRVIKGDDHLIDALRSDVILANCNNVEFLSEHYEAISEAFHKYFGGDAKNHIENALFHKRRYLHLLGMPWSGLVLDVGNDKPFLSFFLKKFNPNSDFCTISYEIPLSPYDLYEVDIEDEIFPFEVAKFDSVIFTEVIEHLWRNPSHTLAEINRVLKIGGNLFLTTPNPCDRHALVCVLWQANPNQRSSYYASLESGHLHLWTVENIKTILASHGFDPSNVSTLDLYGHTRDDENVERIIREISPYRDLMNEAVVCAAVKVTDEFQPRYPAEIYPDGVPVQFSGAIKNFAKQAALRSSES